MKLKSLIFPALASLLIVGVAHGALYEWSKTAATNATADPTINWSEGMSPSSVNDSARAMMARVAEWRDDLSGLLITAGTSTAYTLTSNQGLTTVPTDGQAIAFTVNADNGVAPTLRVDGGTIYPIQSAAGTAIGAGVLVNGAPYTVKFKSASSAWVLHGFYGSPFVIPIGGLIDYTGTTVPNSNFVFPIGQCISRTTYSAFFTLVSTRYGVCDGTTTFGVPDLRGTITAVQDNLGGSARGLITTAGASCDGTTLGTQCGAQSTTIAQANLPNVSFAVAIASGQGSHTHAITGELLTRSGQYTPGGSNFAVGSGVGSITAATLPAMTGTAASGGSGTTLTNLPPLQIVTKLLRIF